MTKEWVEEVNTGKYPGQNPTHKTYNDPSHRSQYSSSFRDRSSSSQYNSQTDRDQSSLQPNQGQRKVRFYYCEGEHPVKDWEKFTRDKAKYKLKMMDLTKKYKNKLRQAVKNGNMSVNEIASMMESSNLVEKAE